MATHTPQASQVLVTYSTTTSNKNTQLNNIKRNHDPLSTPIITSTNSECTLNIANPMQPITLFETNKAHLQVHKSYYCQMLPVKRKEMVV